MKKSLRFSVLLLAYISIILIFIDCKKDEENKTSLAILTTKSPTTITSNSAVVGGFISSDGGATITERGVCFSKLNQNPTIADFVIVEGAGTGNFQCTLLELEPETKYYVRAYALNIAGTGYGNPVSFTTVVAMPFAEFTAVPTNGTKPLSVNFLDQSTKNPTNWNWNFGDGKTSIQQNPNHIYQNAGNYTVELTVSNNFGSDSEQKINYINVKTSGDIGNVTDIDGNDYQTIVIGTQEWMSENLKVIHYRNGEEIPNITEASQWDNISTGAYCWYSNDISWKDAYGALYNWHAVTENRQLCPPGWHVPTEAEWTILTNYLGGESVAGGKMKSIRIVPLEHPRWELPNFGATNESGFSGIPGGYRRNDPLLSFLFIGEYGYFWSSTEDYSNSAFCHYLWSNTSILKTSYAGKVMGLSVRCLRD